MAKEALHQRIEHDTRYHKVDNPIIQEKMEALRRATEVLGHLAVDHCPEGRELSMALTHLIDEFLPTAIGAMARNQDMVVREAMSRGQA
jgi:hypothetical protein